MKTCLSNNLCLLLFAVAFRGTGLDTSAVKAHLWDLYRSMKETFLMIFSNLN